MPFKTPPEIDGNAPNFDFFVFVKLSQPFVIKHQTWAVFSFLFHQVESDNLP